MKKRLLSLLLCLCLLVGTLPLNAAAAVTPEDNRVRYDYRWTDPDTGYEFIFDIYQETMEPEQEGEEPPEGPLYADLRGMFFHLLDDVDDSQQEAFLAAHPIDLVLPGTVEYQGEIVPVKVVTARFFDEEDQALRSVLFPASVEKLGTMVFEGSPVETVAFEDGSALKEIDSLCFSDCANLKTLNLPEGLEIIGSSAFAGSGLESLVLPDSVKCLGSSTFAGCEALTSVTLNEGLETLEYDGAGWNGNFARCTSLTSITLPSTLKALPDRCFFNCESLSRVTFAEGLETIGEQAFYRTNLKELTLPDSLKTIGYYAFQECRELTSVSLGRDLEDLGAGRDVNQEHGDSWTFYGSDQIAVLDMSRCKKLKIIPQAIFRGKRLSRITLPDCLETVEAQAFARQSYYDGDDYSGYELRDTLTQIDLGKGVKTLGAEAFAYNPALTGTVTLPDSLTTLADETVFSGTGITSIRWPKNPDFTTVTGFADCAALSGDVVRTLPESVNTIGSRAFAGDSFTQITVPATVKVIGKGAFSDCRELTSVTFLPGVQDIGREAFAGCFSLTEVELPVSVGYLGSGSFARFDRYTEEESKSPLTVRALNPDLVLVEDDDPYICGSYYSWYAPEDTARRQEITGADAFAWVTELDLYAPAQTSAGKPSALKTYAQERNGSFLSTSADSPARVVRFHEIEATPAVTHTVSGRLPAGATVSIVSGTRVVTPTLTGNAFTAQAEEGVDVAVLVSLEGYADREYRKAGAEFLADWDLGTLPLSDLTPLSETGTLQVTLTGAGASNANLVLVDSQGAVAVSGSASGKLFLAEQLPAGEYTLLAFAENPYFSTVTGEAELTTLGLTTRQYGKAAVTVAAGQVAKRTVTVPALNLSSLNGLVASSSVIPQRNQLLTGQEFYVRVSYKMAAGHPATGLTLNVPDGLTLTYVTSENHSYGALRTITPIDKDRETAVFYVGLRAAKAGSYFLSAMVGTGSLKVPLDGAEFRVDDLLLELPESIVTQRTTPITVYAKPYTPVKVSVGTDSPKTVRTNALGIYRGTLELPRDMVSGVITSVFAEATGADGKEHLARDTLRLAADDHQLVESWFTQGGRQLIHYTVKEGVRSAPGYTYAASGDVKDDYWTFSATIDSVHVAQDVTLTVYMMDGSSRTKPMNLARFETTATGYHQEYVCDLVIQQAGNHVFAKSRIPESYDVTYNCQGKEITLDKDHITYIEKQAQADGQGRTTIIEEATRGLGPGIEILFDGDDDGVSDYIISDEDWFPQLPPETQAEVLEVERIVTGTLDTTVNLLGGKKPWSDYHDVQDLLKDVGVKQSKNNSYNPNTLANQGYDVSPTGGVNENGYAVKKTVNKDGSVQLQYQDPNIKIDWSPAVGAGSNAALTGLGYGMDNLLGKGIDKATRADREIEDILSGLDVDPTKVPKLEKGARYGGAIAKGAFGIFQAKQNSDSYVDAVEGYENQKGNVDNAKIWQKYYTDNRNLYGDACLRAIAREIAAGEALLERLRDQKYLALADTVIGAGFTVAGVITTLASGAAAAPLVGALNAAYDVASNTANLTNAALIIKDTLDYAKAVDRRQHDCGKLKKKGSLDMGNVLLDPSGVVYEAVESNLLEGVTATVVDAATGKPWNAAGYEQVNPQVTESDGAYAWDVPVGTWQVNFTKAGYRPAHTDPMEVPPPRMGLKTGMISTAAPAVTSAKAYPDYVELLFSQYMDVTASLTLPAGYTSQWVQQVPVSETDSTAYSQVLHLIPAQKPALGNTVTVSLAGAKNYAGTALPTYTSGSLKVQARPDRMVLNYTGQIAVLLGETPIPRVTVQVLGTNGKPLAGQTVSASLESSLLADLKPVSAVTDASGIATFSLEGKLPGLIGATFTVDGTSLSTTLPVRITAESNQVARPTATLGTTTLGEGAPKENPVTVAAGTQLVLACATEGAEIYYTTGDTCPCQDMANRVRYAGPVAVTEDTYFRISAYKEGMEYSERLNIRVTVETKPPVIFVDVPYPKGKWFSEAVYHCVGAGYFKGTDDTHFTPDGTMTRAMFATVLYRMAGEPAAAGENPFTDVKVGRYYYNAVRWANQNGIIQGYGNGKFGPDDPVTREQMVTIFWRYSGQPKATGNQLSRFTDADKIGNFAKEAFAWALEKGIINGKGNGILDPKGTARRCEVAQIALNYDANVRNR